MADCTAEMLRRHAREVLRAAEYRHTDAEALQWRAAASVLDAAAARMAARREKEEASTR